ncbi:MAG: hypothetical protein ACREJM_07095, partial [Candidatus Saccharimonadales bacterium]
VSPVGYNGTFTVTAITASTISYALAVNPGAYTVAGTVTGQYQVTGTPYITPPVSWTQSDDVLYLADGKQPVYQLVQTGTIQWTLSKVPFTGGPFLDINASATTLTPTATTITASANTFAATDVGRLLLCLNTLVEYNGTTGGSYMWCVISGYTSPTAVSTTQWYQTVGGLDTALTISGTPGATTLWAFGAWSNTTGYPAVLAMWQQRLLTGNESPTQSQTLRGSVAGYYTGFAPFDPDGTVNPDNSYSAQINAGRADGIQWISATQRLAVGTTGAEYLIGSSGPAITPTDMTILYQTALGSDGLVPPVAENYRLMIMQRGNRQLQEWAYAYFVGGYMATWQNQMAAHITYPSITRMDYALNPFPQLFLLRADGQVIV